jgi:superfamily II RNA helicase
LEIPKIRPSADSRLKKVFARIGVPPFESFKPDPFQLKALDSISRTDCLVSAPTGSGKTWIAQEAIYRIRKKGGRVWYATPLKALTNSKYHEFGKHFGPENLGILTGDIKENANAPIIVGTTEILRNQLYDAMHEGTDLPADLVVLDEAHFLGDEDRGVVWEEVMIYLPVRVNLLLLSATIKNARQVADWLESIRSKTCIVVEETGRPVPLISLFFHPSGRLLPLISHNEVDKYVQSYLKSPNPQLLAPPRSPLPFSEIMRVLRKFDLLPAIFFMKSRSDCDEALEHYFDSADQKNGKRLELKKRVDKLIESHLYLQEHRHLRYLKNSAVASHHSGQLPAWKLLIEHLMTEGLLDAVFATSTVAAGVNFPARSVIFLNSDRYNGHKFIPLNATEFHQMTGRAGRRGKDKIGFFVVLPGKFMDVRLITDLSNSTSENVLSQIKVDFSMVLNLLLSHSIEEIKNIFQKCFSTYQNLANKRPELEQKLKKSGDAMMAFLPKAICGGPEFVIDLIRKRTSIIKEIKDLKNKIRGLESKLSKISRLVPGRLFLDNRGRMYCAIKSQVKRYEYGILACRVKGKIRGRKNQFRLRWFSIQKIPKILNKVIDPPPQNDLQQTGEMTDRTAETEIPPSFSSLPIGKKESSVLRLLNDQSLYLERELYGLICNNCVYFKACHGKTKGALKGKFENFAFIWDDVNAVRMRLWNDFLKHLDFLKDEGFVAENDQLTHDGLWASQLRLDQPLMIAEGLRKGLFPDSDPALLSALVAPFVHDRERETKIDEPEVPIQLLKAYEMFKNAIVPLGELMTVRGFEVRQIELWPAATIFAWANGQPWENVLLISRTADNLRQIASLSEIYPSIAKSAIDAIAMIMREPVAVD